MIEPQISDNALTVLQARYLLRNKEGRVMETPAQMFRRVADTVAQAEPATQREQWADTFYEVMASLEFMPNSPTLMNAGLPNGMLSACISGDTLIYTRDGLKPMANIVEGDMVMTHMGRFRRVIKVWSNGIKSTIGLAQGHSASKYSSLFATPDHRIMLRDGSWKAASEIAKQDIAVPQLWHSDIPFPDKFNMAQYSTGVSKQIAIVDGVVRLVNINSRGNRPKYCEQGTRCKAVVENTPELALVFGQYLANGSIDGTSVRFCMNSTDINAIDTLMANLTNAFGVKPSCNYSNHGNWVDIRIWNIFIRNMFIELFGRGFANKRLPEWISNASTEYRQCIFDGIMFDGYIDNNGISSRLTMANPTLVYQSLLLARSLGLNGNFVTDATVHLSKSPTSAACFSTVSNMNNVTINEGNDIEVFDMEVEEDHSFVAGDFVVHNCFVCGIDDSMESIFDTLKKAALITKSGGGVGFDFSNLRPEGTIVKSTAGVASGPVSFMRVYDSAIDAIKQGGRRRGACMGILRVDHPNIFEFVTCKTQDKTLSNFNISVAVTDEFMDALEHNKPFQLRFDGKVYKTIDPQKLWNLIVHHAWLNGEPGVVFIDTIDRANPTPQLGKITCTNPCVTGDTPILTDKGYMRIDSVVGERVNIWNGYEWSEVEPKVTGENQPVVRVTLSDGSHIDCTPYHRFLIETNNDYRRSDVQRIEAKDLEQNMRIARFQYPLIQGDVDIDAKLAYTMGFYCGDGSWHNNRERASIWLYGKKKALCDRLVHKVCNECSGDRLHLGLAPDLSWDKEFVPDTTWTVQSRLDWLAGLIDSDGGLNDSDGSISIASVNKDFLMHTKYMLVTLGVHTTVAKTHDAGPKAMPDGKGGTKEYQTQETYRLTLAASVVEQLRKLGLSTYRVPVDARPARTAQRYVLVTDVSTIGVADKVYCFNEPLRHAGVFGCVATSQCGEQPLLPDEACNLASINLSKFVGYEQGIPTILYDKLEHTIEIAVRFLDDVITVNNYPLPVITGMVQKTRKIGLGVMGWAEMLIQLGIKYGSDESVKLASSLMEFINTTGEQVSARLAEERGSYPAYAGSVHDGNGPMRNATVTTIAPTGSISMICDTSSGIEPLFGIGYIKNVLDDTKFRYVNAFFERAVQDMDINSDDKEELLDYVCSTGSLVGFNAKDGWSGDAIDQLDTMKELFITAHQVTPEEHVRMQAAFQRHVHNAVSKTCNMPNAATEEDIATIYRLAYKAGCKGITVYRDGSRSGQVYTSGTDTKKQQDEQGAEFDEVIPRKRPQKTYGYTEKIRTGCGTMYMTINADEHGPCETFTYCSNGGCQGLTEGVSRLVSLALRAGVPLRFIIEQLRDVKCPVASKKQSQTGNKSCPDAMGKALQEYSEQNYRPVSGKCSTCNTNTKPMQSGTPCPECGEMNLPGDGCYTCKYCGYSKCS